MGDSPLGNSGAAASLGCAKFGRERCRFEDAIRTARKPHQDEEIARVTGYTVPMIRAVVGSS